MSFPCLRCGCEGDVNSVTLTISSQKCECVCCSRTVSDNCVYTNINQCMLCKKQYTLQRVGTHTPFEFLCSISCRLVMEFNPVPLNSLHQAVANGDVNQTWQLLKSGANPFQQDFRGISAVMVLHALQKVHEHFPEATPSEIHQLAEILPTVNFIDSRSESLPPLRKMAVEVVQTSYDGIEIRSIEENLLESTAERILNCYCENKRQLSSSRSLLPSYLVSNSTTYINNSSNVSSQSSRHLVTSTLRRARQPIPTFQQVHVDGKKMFIPTPHKTGSHLTEAEKMVDTDNDVAIVTGDAVEMNDATENTALFFDSWTVEKLYNEIAQQTETETVQSIGSNIIDNITLASSLGKGGEETKNISDTCESMAVQSAESWSENMTCTEMCQHNGTSLNLPPPPILLSDVALPLLECTACLDPTSGTSLGYSCPHEECMGRLCRFCLFRSVLITITSALYAVPVIRCPGCLRRVPTAVWRGGLQDMPSRDINEEDLDALMVKGREENETQSIQERMSLLNDHLIESYEDFIEVVWTSRLEDDSDCSEECSRAKDEGAILDCMASMFFEKNEMDIEDELVEKNSSEAGSKESPILCKRSDSGSGKIETWSTMGSREEILPALHRLFADVQAMLSLYAQFLHNQDDYFPPSTPAAGCEGSGNGAGVIDGSEGGSAGVLNKTQSELSCISSPLSSPQFSVPIEDELLHDTQSDKDTPLCEPAAAPTQTTLFSQYQSTPQPMATLSSVYSMCSNFDLLDEDKPADAPITTFNQFSKVVQPFKVIAKVDIEEHMEDMENKFDTLLDINEGMSDESSDGERKQSWEVLMSTLCYFLADVAVLLRTGGLVDLVREFEGDDGMIAPCNDSEDEEDEDEEDRDDSEDDYVEDDSDEDDSDEDDSDEDDSDEDEEENENEDDNIEGDNMATNDIHDTSQGAMAETLNLMVVGETCLQTLLNSLEKDKITPLSVALDSVDDHVEDENGCCRCGDCEVNCKRGSTCHVHAVSAAKDKVLDVNLEKRSLREKQGDISTELDQKPYDFSIDVNKEQIFLAKHSSFSSSSSPTAEQLLIQKYEFNARAMLTLRCASCDETRSLFSKRNISSKSKKPVNNVTLCLDNRQKLLSQLMLGCDAAASADFLKSWYIFNIGGAPRPFINMLVDTFLQRLRSRATLSHSLKRSLDFLRQSMQEGKIVGKALEYVQVAFSLLLDVERRFSAHLELLKQYPKIVTRCCGHEHCFLCKIEGFHEGKTCAEVQSEKIGGSCQMCPGCNVSTLRSEGCSEILCVCGKVWEWQGDNDDEDYDEESDEEFIEENDEESIEECNEECDEDNSVDEYIDMW